MQKLGALTLSLQTYFTALSLSLAILKLGLLSPQGLLFHNGLPLYQLGSPPGHSGAFLHTDEVSPGVQFQGLNLSPAWS